MPPTGTPRQLVNMVYDGIRLSRPACQFSCFGLGCLLVRPANFCSETGYKDYHIIITIMSLPAQKDIKVRVGKNGAQDWIDICHAKFYFSNRAFQGCSWNLFYASNYK